MSYSTVFIQVEAWRAAKLVEERERAEREELLRADQEAKLEEVGQQCAMVAAVVVFVGVGIPFLNRYIPIPNPNSNVVKDEFRKLKLG